MEHSKTGIYDLVDDADKQVYDLALNDCLGEDDIADSFVDDSREL